MFEKKNLRSKDERGITICNDRSRSILDQLQLDSPRQGGESIWGVATPWCNDQNQSVGRITAKGEESGRQKKSVAKHRAWLCADHISETFRILTNRGSGSCEVTQLFSFILVEWQLTTPSAMNLWFLLNSRSLARCRVRVKFYRAEDRRVFG